MTKLLTVAEVAEILGIAVSALSSWRSARKGPAYIKVGGSVRYAEDQVRAWLQSQTHEPSPPAHEPVNRGVLFAGKDQASIQ